MTDRFSVTCVFQLSSINLYSSAISAIEKDCERDAQMTRPLYVVFNEKGSRE